MTGEENHNIPTARRRLARIRCLQDCFKSFKENKPFPDALCYVPSEVKYTAPNKTTWKLLEKPEKSSKVVKEVPALSFSCLIASGEEMCNADGKWLRVFKTQTTTADGFEKVGENGLWLLLLKTGSSTTDTPAAEPAKEAEAVNPFDKKGPIIRSWEGVIDGTYSLMLKKHKGQIVPPQRDAVAALQRIEEGWTRKHDACLVNLISKNTSDIQEGLGCVKEYVDSIRLSSYADDGMLSCLTDGSPNTFWETDGYEGEHWIRLNMKKGTMIKSLAVTVDLSDDNYLPELFVVTGGEADNLTTLNTVNIDWDSETKTEIVLLENLNTHYATITINIRACKSRGIDTRIHGLKMVCNEERQMGFGEDFFSGNKLMPYPLLQSYSPATLYRRTIVLKRLIWLLDSVIQYLVPFWHTSLDNFDYVDDSLSLESIRQLLPMSKQRDSLIHKLLTKTVSDPEDFERKLVYINRHAALEHRANPSASSDYRNTVFVQLYEGLKARDRGSKMGNRAYAPLSYRWSSKFEQWWECKFISEAIIDHGGGFRDTLTDMAEELCPSDPDAPIALPFFIRAPNQENEDGNLHRDVYIPNPNCTDFAKYEWIGQLMGACFRTAEILALSLPQYIWKRLVGESYNWSEDYVTVNSAEVKLIDNLHNMDEETFIAAGRSWSLVLSDGSSVSLKLDDEGNPKPLAYEDRDEYAEQVRKILLSECDKQIQAIRRGLLSVIPETVLSLLTWQELEVPICGEAEVTVEGLIKNTYYSSFGENAPRAKMFWAAVRNFTNVERSYLLKFITGRRRLPVSIFLASGKSSPKDPLPEAYTCGSTLQLPSYSDEKICEERLKYAIYNCMSIDNDE